MAFDIELSLMVFDEYAHFQALHEVCRASGEFTSSSSRSAS